MARGRLIPICAVCNEEIVYDPRLGDLDAGPVHVVMPGYTIKLEDICAECMKGLFAWMGGRRAPDNYSGTLRGRSKWTRLPVLRQR